MAQLNLKMGKIIQKHFDSIRKAERYQNTLYNKYNHVRLISFPVLLEEGVYAWDVNDLIKKNKPMAKETIGFRVTWELDGIKQSQIVSSLGEAKKEQDKWLKEGCKVTIAPAKRSPLFTTKK